MSKEKIIEEIKKRLERTRRYRKEYKIPEWELFYKGYEDALEELLDAVED